MLWKEIKIHSTYSALEAISNILQDFNISGIAIKEPITEELDNDKLYELNSADYPEHGVYITFYMPSDEDTEITFGKIVTKIKKLSSFGIDLSTFTYTITEIKEEDWENEWKNYYHSVKVTDRITIIPEWEEYDRTRADSVNIILDPGMAFGTGTHPSTKLSLMGLEKYLCPDAKVIDVGCGSGILSIASAKLGAKSVLSLDLDQLAIKSTNYNASLNDIEEKLTIRQNDLLDGIEEQVDLIVANILANIIILFPKEAYDNLIDGGVFITSGIIKDKQKIVENHLIEAGFTIQEVNTIDHWVSIIAKKQII